jgi:hypothetical protein
VSTGRTSHTGVTRRTRKRTSNRISGSGGSVESSSKPERRITVKASHHPRFWFEVALSVASGLLGLVTLVWRDWIEIVFGVDPDHHSGTLEWVIVFALLLIAVIAGVLARAEWGRQHGQKASLVSRG